MVYSFLEHIRVQYYAVRQENSILQGRFTVMDELEVYKRMNEIGESPQFSMILLSKMVLGDRLIATLLGALSRTGTTLVNTFTVMLLFLMLFLL